MKFFPLLLCIALPLFPPGTLRAQEPSAEPAPAESPSADPNEAAPAPAVSAPPVAGLSPVPSSVRLFSTDVYKADPDINSKILIPDDKVDVLEEGIAAVTELQGRVYKLSRDKSQPRGPDDPTGASVTAMRKELYEKVFTPEQISAIDQINAAVKSAMREAEVEAGLRGMKKDDPAFEDAKTRQRELFNERFPEIIKSILPEPLGSSQPAG